MFSFFKKKPPASPPPEPVVMAPVEVAEPPPEAAKEVAQSIAVPAAVPQVAVAGMMAEPAVVQVEVQAEVLPTASAPAPVPTEQDKPASREGWFSKLKSGLSKTGKSITQLFTGTQIDDALYEDLEAALLMADAGTKATAHLLADLKKRVKDAKAIDPRAVRDLLAAALADLLTDLQRPLVIGEHAPTVIMVAGVNGAGKTTSIGKLTRHLSDSGQSVLLAAADTFRAAAREQLAVWATRASVDIVSQEGADPAAVCFDAVSAGRARGKDVVIADTAGRLPTQIHLMDELKKIKRVIQKADALAPHEVILVIDGNTGQNALTQVKAFDDALQLTGIIVTKLDGTAKGGVLAAIALWARERAQLDASRPPPAVYFIGVGEKLEDLETFKALEFAQALLD
jgi:fused signal recognition particle receptor